MKPLLYTLLFLLATSSFAQPVPSSCTAPANILKLYADDADVAAVGYLDKINSPFTDSTEIPSGLSDTILRAMIAVYNVTASLPAADSVVAIYKIHDHRAQKLRLVEVTADPQAGFVQQVKNGNIPTGFAQFDSIMTKFHLKIISHFKAGGSYFITLESDSNFNMAAIDGDFLAVPDIWSASPGKVIGDGDYILVDSVTTDYVYLSYSWGWMDCPSGCMWRHNWHFRIGYDCSVEFLGGSGDPAVGVGIVPLANLAPRIYPNPVTSTLYVDGLTQAFYSISNMQGQVLDAGNVTGSISMSNLPSGVYFIRLQDKDISTTHQFIKE